MQRAFSFKKDKDAIWYIHIPEWQGDPEELQMVEGADILLNHFSKKELECKVIFANEVLENSYELNLLRYREDNFGGGGDYILKKFPATGKDLEVFLCSVTEFIFGNIPQRLWVKPLI